MKRLLIVISILILSIGAGCSQQIESYDTALTLEQLPGLMEDIRSLEKPTNEERLDVIKTMLETRNIPYELETYTIEKTGRLSNYPRSEGTNIVVTIGEGSGDILIGGHWDAVWLKNGSLSKGVVDNGSSCVVLVRLAEKLQSEKLNHRIRIVFFDMEEIGLIGSKKYVEAHTSDDIRAVVNLDVLGYGESLMFGPRNTAGNNPIYRALKGACVDLDINFVEFPEYPHSDDRSFQDAGIDNISIGTGPAGELHHLWLLLHGHDKLFVKGSMPSMFTKMHSEGDNSSNVDTLGMTAAYNAVLETVKRLDVVY